MFKLILILLFLNFVNAEDIDQTRLNCLKCICHATTACLNLTVCAIESISLSYWKEAATPTVDNEFNNETIAYSKCIQNNNCVLQTVDQYTNKILGLINDINCDGIIDCRDHFAVHKYGMSAKDQTSIFKLAEMKRFDICTGSEVANLTNSGWKPNICFVPRNSILQ